MSADLGEWLKYDDRLEPLRERMHEAKKKIVPPMPSNYGIECCSVRSKDFPESAMANWVRDMPSKIEDIKENVRLNLVFYCALHHMIEPEEDIKDRARLDELCEKLDEKFSRNQICEKNIVRQWRFIRDMTAVKDLRSFF